MSYIADKYYRYDELVDLLHNWKDKHGDIFDYEVIGVSYENRDIYAITISSNLNNHSKKPAYYIDANHHAGEVTGSAVALYTVNYLLNNQSDKQVRFLLDNYTFYIIPRISVDGSEFFLTTPYSLRSSVREYSQTLKKGLLQEDIDKDGRILQMRFKSDLGSFKVSEKDPRLMVKREPDDIYGDFYEVVTEGLVEDYDGVEVKPFNTKWGLDFNRNYPIGWNPENIQKGAGPYPLSENETRAVANFVLSHDNIAGIMSYHTYGGVILRPYCTKPDKEIDKQDLEFFKNIGVIGEDLTGYPCWSIFEKFTMDKDNPSAGSFIDFVYDNLGITAFATELWDLRGRAGLKKITFLERLKQTNKEQEEDGLKLLEYNDEEFNGELFVNWYKVQHPQLGEVELGGWVPKYSMQNPPEKHLEEECHKNMLFTLAHAAAMPRLDIQDVKVTDFKEGIYQVIATLVNKGFLCTSGSVLASKQEKYKKITVGINGECEVLSEKELVYENLNGFSKKKIEFIVKTNQDHIKLVAKSLRAGSIEKETKL